MSKLRFQLISALRRSLPVAAAAVMLSACGGARPATIAGSNIPIGSMGAEAAVARARADSLRYPYTKADIDFMSGMISHHAQAVVMAKWAPTHGASLPVIRLSERIITSQNDEI